jgi:sarcosine oxidase
MPHFDVIVLGAGGVGSAAAWHLARRGARVLVIEQFEPGHGRGSSHGETRIIRQAYFEHPDYVPLLLRAYELWRELEAQLGDYLLEQVGLIQVGPEDGEVVPGVLRAAREHGLAVHKLTANEVAERFPAFRVPDGLTAVFERAAGYLRVESCVLAHLAAAKSAATQFLFNTPVRGWSADKDGVLVTTDGADYRADRLVIAAGPWAPQMLADLGVPLTVVRKHAYWFASTNPAVRQDVGCPTFLFELPEGVFYGFPQRDALGVKVAEHSGGVPVADPSTDTRQADVDDERRVDRFLQQCLPGVGPPVIHRSVCYYTMSPDGHFIVDRHPQHENVVFAAGLSGHGFKFTSVLGEVLAEMTLNIPPTQPVDFLRLGRFARSN